MTFDPKTRTISQGQRSRHIEEREVKELNAQALVCGCRQRDCLPCVVRKALKSEGK